MKKISKGFAVWIISFIMLFIMIAVFSISAVENEGISDKRIEQVKVNEMIVEGCALMKQRTYRTLDITKYYQNRNGDPWINNKMKTDKDKIRSSGCTVTTFTMLHNYYSKTSLDPGLVNARLGKYACPFYYSAAAEKYGYTYDGYVTCYSVNDYKAVILTYINKNIPVMVQLNNPSGGYHYVLAAGYNNTEVLINDPDIYKNHSKLTEYINEGYSVGKLHIFSR